MKTLSNQLASNDSAIEETIFQTNLSIYLFEEIVTDDSHKLYNLLPPRNETVSMTLRSSHRFNVTLQKLIAKREWQSIKLHASTESVKFQLPGVGFLYDTYRSI
jgi:hypothetical protein